MTWMDDAACLGVNTDMFYGRENAEALRLCREVCTVRTSCLEYAMAAEESAAARIYGVYGGVTPEERKRLHKVFPGGRGVREALSPGDQRR